MLLWVGYKWSLRAWPYGTNGRASEHLQRTDICQANANGNEDRDGYADAGQRRWRRHGLWLGAHTSRVGGALDQAGDEDDDADGDNDGASADDAKQAWPMGGQRKTSQNDNYRNWTRRLWHDDDANPSSKSKLKLRVCHRRERVRSR